MCAGPEIMQLVATMKSRNSGKEMPQDTASLLPPQLANQQQAMPYQMLKLLADQNRRQRGLLG